MKRFSEFIKETDELRSLGGSATNQYGRWGQEPVHMGVHRIEDPNVLQRLNAHVGLVNTREYIDPRSALEHLQNALMRLGFQFEYNINDLPNEQNVYPLRRFGGRQGFIDMDGEIKEDDGIENAVGEALVLNVEFAQDPGTSRYDVFAQIVPASLFDEEEVTPEAIKPNRAGVPAAGGDRDGINMAEGIGGRRKLVVGFPLKSNRDAAIKAVQRSDFPATASALFAGSDPDPGAVFIVRDAGLKITELTNTFKKHKGTVVKNEVAQGQFKEFRTISQKSHIFPGKRPVRDPNPRKTAPMRFKGDPTVKVDKTKGGWQVYVYSPRGYWIAQGQVWPSKAEAEKDARQFESVNEDVSISSGREKGDLWEVELVFRGGPIRKQALTFHRAALSQQAFQSSKHTSSGNTEKVVVTLKASNSRDAQVKVRKLLDKPAAKRLAAQYEQPIDEAAVLDRTFAFPTADARDRVERLLDLASSGRVTKSDKGKGKFKFTVSAGLRSPQIAKIMNAVNQLKGKVAEESDPVVIGRDAVRRAIQERNGIDEVKDVAKGHQMKIARDTLKMNPVFQKVMGGMSKRQAAEFLMKNGNAQDKKAAKKALAEAKEIAHRFRFEDEEKANRFVKQIAMKSRGAFRDRTASGKGVVIRATFGSPAEAKVARTKAFGLGAVDEAKDENCKEVERTKKDNKLAGGFKEQLSKRKKAPKPGY